ncbi:MAG: hypothetical protein L0H84_23290 [Pseudonocardia sp.]|nr:hypothetical protein [Pseudonocardia sp.]
MPADPVQRLAETLGRPAAEFRAFAGLQPAELDLLADAVVETGARQQESLQRAVEESLRHVPALLRGPIKAAVGLR